MPFLILDPGHGGSDSGAIAIGGIKEKDLNLEMAMYMYHRFTFLGVDVGLTRDKDITLDSVKRTKIVRDSKAKYCLSVHFNAGGGDGFEGIYSIYATDKLANLIADEVKKIGQNVRRIFKRTLPNNPKQDYYYMHRETGTVETVILEGFFGDNKKDFADFDTWEERKELAEAYIKGFCKHVGIKYYSPIEESKNDVFYRVVTGSYNDKKNAEKRVSELKAKGFESFIAEYKK